MRHQSHSLEFRRQIVQEYLAGDTIRGRAKRHDISSQLIRVWIEKYDAGAFDDDAQAADLIQQYDGPHCRAGAPGRKLSNWSF
jgi:transposase